MAGKSIEIGAREGMAETIVSLWSRWNDKRQIWLDRGLEARRYVTSVDTSTTEVGYLAWKNKTTIPKLTQIADNLHAYYMAALMPTDEWFVWEGSDPESRLKAKYIEAYLRIKLKMSNFRNELERAVKDWIMYGNCFGSVSFVKETGIDPIHGEPVTNYLGPKFLRVSPLRVVVDVRATSIDDTPVVLRELRSITDVLRHNEESLLPAYDESAIQKVRELRGTYRKDWVDAYTDEGLFIDGFVSWDDYLDSQTVELLTYMGDLFDPATGEVKYNRVITVADRSFILRDMENPSWNGMKPMAHSAWRILPDNFYGQGPLDNLVGMQYRCDHLENLKADTFDQIVHPPVVVYGDTVDDFVWGPGVVNYAGADGKIEVLRPDASVLQCDNQIALYHMYMELMAGSPKESMGFRTPGEKTAFEVQVLQQGADRMFLDKVNHFEDFVQKILNIMYEMMVRNMDEEDIASTFKNDPEVVDILGSVTREDVVARGTIVPMGAKHYETRLRRVQELQNFLAMSAQSPKVDAHVSGLRAAEMLEEELGLDKWDIVEQDVGIKEQILTQFAAQQLQQQLQAMSGGGFQAEGEEEGGMMMGEEMNEA